MHKGKKVDLGVIWRKIEKKEGGRRIPKLGTQVEYIGTIARELHLSVSTVKCAISDLEENGFIRKKQRWRDNGSRSSLLFEIIK